MNSPRQEIESQVCEVFAQVLELDTVSADDDFFDLGGDSFFAVQIALELEQRFAMEIPVEELERLSRVGDLAGWLDEQLSLAGPANDDPGLEAASAPAFGGFAAAFRVIGDSIRRLIPNRR